MSVVTLTFILSQAPDAFGTPQVVTIEANMPSTIYYTLDGTVPTQNSTIYVNPISLPIGAESTTLSAFGVDGAGNVGPILTQIFITPVQPQADQSRIDRTRLVGQEGFAIQRDGTNPEYVAGYGADGTAATYMNFEPDLIDMDKVHSEHGGEGFEGAWDGVALGTAVEIGKPDAYEESERYNAFVPFSTTEVGEFFDPQAAFILIDTRKPNDLNPVLRGYMSLDNIYTEFGGKRLVGTASVADDASYISGGYVKRFYNSDTNTMCTYFYDHNNCHWIKSVQPLPSGAPVMPRNGIGIANNAKIPLVFPWIYRGRPSLLV